MQDAERDKNPVLAGIPGVTPETPEAGWERVTGGPRAMAAGFSKLDPPPTQPNPTATEAIKGAAELIGGAFQTASPLLAVAGGEAALGARAAYPLVRDMIAIYGADKAVEMAAQKLNLSPDATALLKNMVMLAAPAVAARGIAATEPRGGTLEGPGITAGAGDILGGKAGGFYARTPDEYAAGAKVGPFEAAVRIPRNGGSAEASGQPALPQAPAPDASAQLITKYNNAVAKLQRVVTGQEPLIPPPPPPPTPPPAVTAQDVTRETQRIVKLPPDQQGPALQDAHAKLAQTLLAQGQTGKPVVLPNGQLAQIPDEKTASKVAIGLINDAVKDHDKAQEDAAKVAGKESQKQAKEDAKPAPTNGNRQTRGERAAQLSEPVAKMVEAPAEPEFKMVEGNGNGQTEQAAKAEQVQPENQSAVGKAAGGNGAGNGAGGSEAVHAGRVDTTGKEEAKPESVISKHDSVTFPTKVQLEGRIVQPGETGTVQWADANSARVKLDSDGKVINSVALRHIEKKESPAESDRRHNLAERKRVAEMSPEELKKELLTSPVTGIPNRRAFDEAEHTPAKAVAMSDADGLKALNDRFGYAAGNQLLKAKAEALQEAGLEAYHEKGDEFLYRGNSSQELKTKLEKARSILRDRVITVTHDGEEQRFKGADFSHGTGTSLEEAERGLKAHKSEREAKGERARGELRGITQVGSEKGEVVQGGTEEVKKPKYKFGSTQANIPADSEAAKGLGIARSIISKDDLAGKGKDIGEGGEHVTVRYGIKNEDTEGIRKFLSEQSPFEATLGKTEKFPVSEHSEGAAPIIAPIEAPDLHRMNAELEKHGDFSEPSFDKYKPHATVAYVKPDKADRYVGMEITKGKKFTVNEIAISKKDGSQEVVKLEGKKAAGVKLEAAKNEALGPAPGEVGRMKVSDLHVAPHKFQYKLGTDTSGTGTLLKETKVYNPQLAGTISVWRDPADGKWYVVNGHHRFELAKRSIQTRVNVMHIEAKDAAEARAIGARQNIGEGRGTPIDAAKFFRETSITPEDLEKHGISLGEATASNGLALSKLSDPLFTKVVQGELPQGQAIAIGEGTSDHAEQAAILKQIERKERGGGKVSADRIREFIRLAKGSEQRTETTADLFGSQEVAHSLAWEKSEISEYIQQQLAKDKKLFGFVSKGERATELERAGNKIDVEKSKEIATGAAQAAEVYEKLSTKGGPISAILDDSARRLADGDNAGTVKSDAYQAVRAEVSKTLGGQQREVPEGLEKGTHEPSLYFPENPKSLRHTTGPLSAGDALGIEFTERDPGNGVPNYLRLNSSALNIVRRAEGHQFNGISMAKSAVREVTNKLDDYAEELFIRGYPAAAEKVRTVANAMWRSFRKEDGLTIVAAHSDPAEEIKVIHEELYHAAVQRRAGGGRLARGVPEEMISDPGIAKMRPRIEAEVPGAHSLIVLTEAAADLAVGTYDELTPAEAETSSEHYYTALADANGVKPLEAAQAIFDHIDSLAAEAGIIKPGEQFNAEGNGPNRAALTRILGSRRGTPDSGSSLRARPDVEEPPSIEQRNISAAGNNSVAKNGEDGTVAPANVRPDAGTSTLGGPDLGRHSVRLGESDAGREASRRSEEVQAGQNGGEPESRPARSGSAAGNLSREGAGSGRVAKNTPAALHSTAPVGLTDDELADWSKSRGFRYEPAGEQLGIFGGNDQVVRVFRTGAKGKEERGLAYQNQINKLSTSKEEPTEPFSLTGGEAPKEEQPRLFGAGDLGEIIGTPQGKAKPPAKDDYSLFSGQRGIARTGAINPIEVVKNAKKVYDDLISKVIDQKLDLGDKYRRVAQHDPVIAKMLHEKDQAPRYFHEKAESNVHQVVKGLSEDQIRSAAMMADSDSREYLEAKYPEQYDKAKNDLAVMAAVKKFKGYQDQLAALRISLGWHVRRDLSAVENEDGTWNVLDRDGKPIEAFGGKLNTPEVFKTFRDAQDYVEQEGKLLDHLKRVYPEHLREPLMGKTNEGPGIGGSFGGIKAPRPDKRQRLATAEYFYQHGAKDFTGYIKSFTQAYHAALNQKIFDAIIDESTQWKDGTSAPSSIEYRGKTYYRPEIAKSMKQDNPFKIVPEYKAYDPAKGDKMLIKSFEDGWATQSTGRPGISPTDRYLAPKEVVDALDNYDMTRGVRENDSIRRFFQDQIVGLFGPTVHVFNIMRRLAHVAGTGVWDPRVWPYLQKLFASQELRDRMAEGLADDTIDFLSKHGSYTNARDIGSLHDYFLGNMDPRNWARWTIGKFSKGILFDPKFMGGRGGLDQKARVLAADIYRGKGMSEEEASKRVEEDFGKYNKANWTERMKRWARALLFPGWDFSSIMHFLRMPLKTALYPALATVLANLGLNLLGKNKDQDKYDYSYIHYGDRKYRTGLVTESIAAHIAEPLLAAGRAALEHEDVTSAAISGGVRGLAGVAGNLRPDMMMAASVVFNREYPGGSKEIWKPEDSFLPGKVTPTRKLDKILAFTLVKTFPAVNRFMDSSYDNVDMMTGAGSVLGVSNYKAGAEERLRANAARSKGYSQELSDLNATNPEAAEKLEQDPDKAIYLLFNKDFSELEKELSDIDKEMRDTRMTDGISSAERKEHLADLEEDRKQHLASADAIADEIAAERAGMRKEARK